MTTSGRGPQARFLKVGMAIEYHRRACRKCRAAHPDVAVDLTCPTGRALNKKAGKFLLEMMAVPR